jgi:hypothetical protein
MFYVVYKEHGQSEFSDEKYGGWRENKDVYGEKVVIVDEDTFCQVS